MFVLCSHLIFVRSVHLRPEVTLSDGLRSDDLPGIDHNSQYPVSSHHNLNTTLRPPRHGLTPSWVGGAPLPPYSLAFVLPVLETSTEFIIASSSLFFLACGGAKIVSG